MIRTLFITVLAVLAVLPTAQAKGVEVGAQIPAIATVDQHGKQQSFDTLKGAKGMTLVFVRSVEWCPFCQRQVIELSENAKKFKDAGYPVVTISYDSAEKLAQFEDKFKITLPMLSDSRSDIIKAFGIFNENYAKGTMAYGTPFPGVYIVKADKTVKAKFFKEGVQDRPAIKELLSAVEEPAPVDPAVEFPQEETSSSAPVVMDDAAPVEPAPMPTEEELMAAPEEVAPVAPETPAMPDPMGEGDAPSQSTITVETPAMPEPSVVPATEPVAPSEFIPPMEDESSAPMMDEPTQDDATPPGL